MAPAARDLARKVALSKFTPEIAVTKTIWHTLLLERMTGGVDTVAEAIKGLMYVLR